MITTRITFNGAKVRLGPGVGFKKYKMLALGQLALDTVKARVAKAVGSDDAAMKPLKERYAKWKQQIGLDPIRDLHGPGQTTYQARTYTKTPAQHFTGFKAWWNGLTEAEMISVERAVLLLEERGPNLPFPYCSRVNGSRHSAMRELRVQHQGRPYRVLYIFDPRRVALLLLGGDKTGDDRWYERNVPLADQLYDDYIAEIEEEDDAKDDQVQ